MEPRIAATDNNRFIVAWERGVNKSEGRLDDIYFTIRDANGSVVKGVTKFTNGVAGDERYEEPTLTALDGNRAFLAYGGPDGISYAVIDSVGDTVRSETPTWEWGGRSDAVQLSNGNVVVAWEGSIGFIVVDGTTYDRINWPVSLYNPGAFSDSADVSLAADQSGHAILTWTDRSNRLGGSRYSHNLYYALVDSDGNVVTEPMVFRTSQTIAPQIETSHQGYGNTSRTGDFTPPVNPASLNSTTHTTDTWSNNATVGVTWSGAIDIDSGVDGYSVAWDQVPTSTPDTIKDLEDTVKNSVSHPLADGDWYFHLRTVDNAGNWALGAVHAGPFRIDQTAPSSSAESPEYTLGQFTVTWNGLDSASGIVAYDVHVRDGDVGAWNTWLADTTALSATHGGVTTGHTYCFRSVARDAAGNIEPGLPPEGDTCTTVACYKVEGQVTNNRHRPIFNATVTSQPEALNRAASNPAGDYALYFNSSGPSALTASRSGFGVLPPRNNIAVSSNPTGVDFVLPPVSEAVTNGGWETGDFSGWYGSPGITHTVEATAPHTGYYGAKLQAGEGSLQPSQHISQTVSIPNTWSQPTLSLMFRPTEAQEGDGLLATISGESKTLTHTVLLTSAEWLHSWCDLTPLRGQTVTLRFGFLHQTPGQGLHLDEISVGETRAGVYPVYLPRVMRRP